MSTVIPVISALGVYLISKLAGAALLGGLIEDGAYFKVRTAIHMKFPDFVIFFFQITISSYHYHSLIYNTTTHYDCMLLSCHVRISR